MNDRMKMSSAQCVPLCLLLCPAPPPPANVTAIATSGSSITVTWTPPTLPDNRPPITGYTVTAVPSNSTTVQNTPSSHRPSFSNSTILGGLQRGTVYTIKVVAHSIVGDSLSENYTIDFSGKHASSVTLSEWTVCVCGSMDLISAL